MSAALPLFLTRPGKPIGAYDLLREIQQDLAGQGRVLLRYAQHLVRNLEKAGLRPDKHWYDNRADFAPPPPNPTAAPAAPKAAKPSSAKSLGQAIKAAAEAVCGFLGGIAPLVPNYYSDTPNKSLTPDENRKFWQHQY